MPSATSYASLPTWFVEGKPAGCMTLDGQSCRVTHREAELILERISIVMAEPDIPLTQAEAIALDQIIQLRSSQ